MNPIDFFFPPKKVFPNSKYNKHISVLKYLGSTTLIVDGLVQSGDVMTRVWKKGISSLIPKNFIPENVLLLGLAGGCNAKLINRYFPKAQITGVDVDQKMIDIGKNFFHLNKVKNLKIIIDDALDYIKKLKKEDRFDLIMVDCFIGKKIPKKLESLIFLKSLKQHSRFVLVNRLFYMKDKQITLNFFNIISPYFFFIKTHTTSNVIISLV